MKPPAVEQSLVARRFAMLCLFATLALGCRALEARPLVLLSISGTEDWSGFLVDHVLITVADESRRAPGPLSAANESTLKLGIYLPRGRKGETKVSVQAMDADDCEIGNATTTVVLAAGEKIAAAVSVRSVPRRCPLSSGAGDGGADAPASSSTPDAFVAGEASTSANLPDGEAPSPRDLASCQPCTAPPNAEATCEGKVCGFKCHAGFHPCGLECRTDTDPAACGEKCEICPSPAGSKAVCRDGACDLDDACAPGTRACSGGKCVPEGPGSCCVPSDCGDNPCRGCGRDGRCEDVPGVCAARACKGGNIVEGYCGNGACVEQIAIHCAGRGCTLTAACNECEAGTIECESRSAARKCVDGVWKSSACLNGFACEADQCRTNNCVSTDEYACLTGCRKRGRVACVVAPDDASWRAVTGCADGAGLIALTWVDTFAECRSLLAKRRCNSGDSWGMVAQTFTSSAGPSSEQRMGSCHDGLKWDCPNGQRPCSCVSDVSGSGCDKKPGIYCPEGCELE